MTKRRLEIAVVGAGPRGLSVLERLCANERHAPSHDVLVVHMIDPSPPGAGAVWRTAQSRHLLMNTVTSQITVFTDDSVGIDGPVEPGPSLYEWARGLALLGDVERYGPETIAEARALGPDAYPSRAFYGHYLDDCFRRVVADAPGHIRVVAHRSRAVAMADTHGSPSGPQGVRLENGVRLNRLDAVVLAQGHLPSRLTRRDARTASLARIHHLAYFAPANPADVDLSGVRPGRNVLLRGLGLNFFDHMTLLTAGRGGTFVQGDGRLVYRPSGQEPRLYAFSRRGVPYHARGENEKGAHGRHLPRFLDADRVAALRRRAARGERVDFRADVWPLISREVEGVHYGALLAARGQEAERARFTERWAALGPDADPAPLLAESGITEAERWDWDRLAHPLRGRTFTGRADFRAWLLDHLARDVVAAREGNVSGPLKAALDVLRDLRNEIRLVVDHGGLAGDSHRDDLEGWYTPLNAFLSIGPPVSRIEEMTALIEAGVLTVLGPGVQVRLDTNAQLFVARSEAVPGEPVRATTLIEARLPEPDLRCTADPLLRHLLDTDQVSAYRIDGPPGTAYETGGLAVTERPYHLLDGRGRAHPRRFAYGVPTEAVHWVTAAGIRPGVDSVTLGDSDAIARTVLALPPVARTPAAVGAMEPGTGLTEVVV